MFIHQEDNKERLLASPIVNPVERPFEVFKPYFSRRNRGYFTDFK